MTRGPVTEFETRIQNNAAVGLPTVVPDAERMSAQAQVSATFLRVLLLQSGSCTQKGLVLVGATITGAFDCSDLTIEVPVRLLACQFSAPVVFSRSRLRLLDLRRSRLSHLAIDEATVEQSVLLRRAVVGTPDAPVVIAGDEFNTRHSIDLSLATITGMVRLLGATIGGQLSCRGARIKVERGDALSMDGATVKGNVFLDEEFTAAGVVRLLGATIGGALFCSGAKIIAVKGGNALVMDRADVKGGVFLNRFTATGLVRLLGTTIGGQLSCSGATIKVEKGNVILDAGFAAMTNPRLPSLRADAHDPAAETGTGTARTQVAMSKTDVGVDGGAKGIVSLRGAKLGELRLGRTNGEASGGQAVGLDIILLLAGTTYAAISAPTEEHDGPWLRRVGGWICGDRELRRDPGRRYRAILVGQQGTELLAPQEALQEAGVYPATYDVMARVLREMGDERLSTQLLMEKHRQIAKTRSWLSHFLSWLFLDLMVGYGYRPRLALLWAGVVYVAASLVFLGAVHHGGIVATPLADTTGNPSPLHATSSYPSFSAWNYALGSLLSPFVELPGIDAWRANTLGDWGVAAQLMRWTEPVVMWGLVVALGTSLT